MLARSFFALAGYAQTAMSRAFAPPTPTSATVTGTPHTPHGKALPKLPVPSDHSFTPPAELDVMLPKVCEALVLVAQCMVTTALEAEAYTGGSPTQNPKKYFNEARLSKLGLVESLVGKLVRCL